jgi:hypothetical protein
MVPGMDAPKEIPWLVHAGSDVKVLACLGGEDLIQKLRALANLGRPFTFQWQYVGDQPAPRIQPAGLPAGVEIGPVPRILLIAIADKLPEDEAAGTGTAREAARQGLSLVPGPPPNGDAGGQAT